MIGLGGSLTGTALFLHVMSPPPLAPQASPGLFAQDQPEAMSRVVAHGELRPANPEVSPAPAAISPGWKFIYIHHSKTPEGDARTLANPQKGLGDHFLIGNGAGAADGEVQISHRWQQQLPPLPPEGARAQDDRYISICLVGDFERTSPTQAQVRQLGRLVSKLQHEYQISTDSIYMAGDSNLPAGIGARFPIQQFRQHLAAK